MLLGLPSLCPVERGHAARWLPPCLLPAASSVRDALVCRPAGRPSPAGSLPAGLASGPASSPRRLAAALTAPPSKSWVCPPALGEDGCHSRAQHGTCFLKDLLSERYVFPLEQRMVYNNSPERARRF